MHHILNCVPCTRSALGGRQGQKSLIHPQSACLASNFGIPAVKALILVIIPFPWANRESSALSWLLPVLLSTLHSQTISQRHFPTARVFWETLHIASFYTGTVSWCAPGRFYDLAFAFLSSCITGHILPHMLLSAPGSVCSSPRSPSFLSAPVPLHTLSWLPKLFWQTPLCPLNWALLSLDQLR